MPQVPAMYERYIICRKFGAEVSPPRVIFPRCFALQQPSHPLLSLTRCSLVQVHLTSVIAGPDIDFAKNAENFLGYAKKLADDNEDYWTPLQVSLWAMESIDTFTTHHIYHKRTKQHSLTPVFCLAARLSLSPTTTPSRTTPRRGRRSGSKPAARWTVSWPVREPVERSTA